MRSDEELEQLRVEKKALCELLQRKDEELQQSRQANEDLREEICSLLTLFTHHVAHVRGTGRVGVDHLLEITRPQACAAHEGEEVDDLLSVRTQQVGPQDAVGALLDECLEPRIPQRYPPRGLPARSVLVVRGKAQSLCTSRFLKKAHPYERRGRKDHARDAGIVGCVPVALQEVAGHDASLHACHGCQGEPAAGHYVPRCVYGWIGHALQVLVHQDALLPMYHARRLQVEFVDLRRTPGGMHHQVSLDRMLLRSCAGVDEQVVALSFNGGDRPVHLDLDAQFPACLHQHGDEIRVKLLEGTASPVEHLDLCACASCDVGELKGDVAAADENDAARQFLQIQELRAGGEQLLARYPQIGMARAGRDHHVATDQGLLAHLD